MVRRNTIMLIVCLSTLTSSIVLPAYAEVTSVQTDRTFYTPGSKIHFTGTVAKDDYQKLVNIVIHDPTGNFVLITGGFSNADSTFQIIADAGSQFRVKGTYNATAFIGKESDGKTVRIDFSPDGSPVIHPTPQTQTVQNNPSSSSYQSQGSTQATQNNVQTNTPASGTNNDPSVDQIIQQRIDAAKKLKELLDQQKGKHVNTELSENIGVVDYGSPVLVNAGQAGKLFGQYDFKNVLYPLIALGGIGIVVAILFSRKRFAMPQLNTLSTKKPIEASLTIPSSDEPEEDYALMILRNRLVKGEISIEDFKSIKEVLIEP